MKSKGGVRMPRQTIVSNYEKTVEAKNDMIRSLVIDHGRIDIFCEYILGGEPPMWFHQDMMNWQDSYDEAMILAFRGARKTAYLTIARTIMLIIRNPNIRILFASDAEGQSKIFLRSIKSHFMHNDALLQVFGDYVTGADRWAESEIIVNKRTAIGMKEGTVTCVGMDTATLGKHFDVIIADDLVTEENSSTDGMRQRVYNYFYKTLLHCLDPGGKMWVIGTRWHEEDLYGHLEKEDYKNKTYVLGVLDEETDMSVWEEKFPTERMHRIRKGSLSAFELQLMCRSGRALGGIFKEDHFRYYESIPEPFTKWQAADLAAGMKARNDFFAHVTLGVQKITHSVYLISYTEAKMLFPRQVSFIAEKFNEHPETVRVGIEANAYQIVLTQQVRQDFPHVPVVPRWTIKDKVARAQQLALFATEHPIYIKPGHHRFMRRLCSFPHGPKDVFDAFDIAVGMGLGGVRKKREYEPGLI